MDSPSVLSSLGSWYGVMGTLTGVAVTIAVVWRLCRRRRKRAKIYPADTLIVHQFGRGLFVPNQSPFCLKLETYLRMAKIPYQVAPLVHSRQVALCTHSRQTRVLVQLENDLSNAMSSKSKSPWMTYNGQDIADSQFCIEFINKKFEVDLNTSLSERDQAVALAFRKLIEDNFYWCMVMWRFVYDSDWTDLRKVIRVPYPILLLIQRAVKKQASGQGMGRHSREEVLSIADTDLRALSAFLGTKKFFMGDTPTEIDACVFASLAQVKWQMQRSPWEKLVKDELVNLSDYCDMMKRLYWPDWDDCITHGATKKAAA